MESTSINKYKSWFMIGFPIFILALVLGILAYMTFLGAPTSLPQSQPETPPLTTTARESPTTTPVVTETKPTSPNTQPKATTTPELITERFVIPLASTTTDQLAESLYTQGFIKNKTAFTFAFMAKGGIVSPGAYKISKEMSALEVVEILMGKPYMKWIVIPPGLRKEEIAGLLAKTLGWSEDMQQKWINTYTVMKFDYIEGVYFPDSYLIPVDESPLDVANRITAKFNERFASYIPQFNQQNIKWTTGLTFASILQREAANAADMPLISGILWNRIKAEMPLQTDATLQYIRGNTGSGWWAPISVTDKQIDSPYNTYENKGLPPHPISNPGIPAIEATLNPLQTNCIYYLHDKDHITHCAVTYEEHKINIQKYLLGN